MLKTALRLVVFDLDGTLVDSRHVIVACAQAAFAGEGLAPPPAEAIARIVGLSLDRAAHVLLGRDDPALVSRLSDGYRRAFIALHEDPAFDEPLFPGALTVLDGLAERGVPLAIATGKGRRGLLTILEKHCIRDRFVSLQTADAHPSKPHPAMLLAALADAGVAPAEAVMVGDTTFDIVMAKAAGVAAIGVAWGNHPAAELTEAGAVAIIDEFPQLMALLPAG